VRRLSSLAILAAGLALVTPASAGDSTPIRATRLVEQRPVSGNGYLAWAQNSRKHPKLYKTYVQLGQGQPSLLKTRRQAYPGSISGTTLVYQEYAPARNESSIRFYDLAQRRLLPTPAGVNTRLWEWNPSHSGEWLLFSRHNGRTESVILMNTVTRAQIELDRGRMPDDGNYGLAGQVNGNFAVWQRCPRGARPCTVFRYDITTRVKTQLAPPLGFLHYNPSVATDGITYLVRSETDSCGSQVELWRYPLVGEPTHLFGLPFGRDILNSYVETKIGTGGPVNEVYHDRASCTANRSDLWRHTDATTPGG
jgi:hypothetical protein